MSEPILQPERVRQLRHARGLTQEQLAERAAIRQSSVSQIERGEQVPTVASLVALARALGTSMEYLLGLTDDASPFVTASDLDALEREAITLFRNLDLAQRHQLLQVLTIIVSLAQPPRHSPL